MFIVPWVGASGNFKETLEVARLGYFTGELFCRQAFVTKPHIVNTRVLQFLVGRQKCSSIAF